MNSSATRAISVAFALVGLPVSAQQSTVSSQFTSGAWSITQRMSRTDDSSLVSASVRSLDEVARPSSGPSKLTLGVRCRANVTEVALGIGVDIGPPGADIKVQYRFDSLPAAPASWRVSPDSLQIGLWAGASSIPFIKAMEGKTRLALRFPGWGEQRELTFDITGVEGAMRPVRLACKW